MVFFCPTIAKHHTCGQEVLQSWRHIFFEFHLLLLIFFFNLIVTGKRNRTKSLIYLLHYSPVFGANAICNLATRATDTIPFIRSKENLGRNLRAYYHLQLQHAFCEWICDICFLISLIVSLGWIFLSNMKSESVMILFVIRAWLQTVMC